MSLLTQVDDPRVEMAGASALPLPHGDPTALWMAAGDVQRAAAEARSGVLASTAGRLPWLGRTWAGAAANEAAQESALLAGRIDDHASTSVEAAACLAAYGDALDVAQRIVVGLQTEWDAVVRRARGAAAGAMVPLDPVSAAAAEAADAVTAIAIARLRASYAVTMADLRGAGDVAAYRLGDLVQGLPARVSPGPTDDDVRRTTLDGLDLVAGRLAWESAQSAVSDITGRLDAVVAGDVLAVGPVGDAIRAHARDPVFAAALMARLGPDGVAAVVTAVARGSRDRLLGGYLSADQDWLRRAGTALVASLGAAMATAASPAVSTGLDTVSTRRLDRWRGPWLQAMAASATRRYGQPDGSQVPGAWVQGQLLAGALRSGVGPGVAYASTVGVALVAAERPSRSGSTLDLLLPQSRPLRVGDLPSDAVTTLARSLHADVAAARAWLLHDVEWAPGSSPGPSPCSVIDYLVRERHLLLARGDAAASLAAVSALVVEAGADPRSAPSALLAASFVEAVGSTATAPDAPGVADLATFRQALSPALWDVATVVGSHPDALVAALAGPSAGAALPAGGGRPAPAGDLLLRHGRDPGTYDIVVRRAAVTAVLGELALDPTTSTNADVGAAPAVADGRPPAVAHALDLLGRQLDADLVDALRLDQAGDPHALDVAATHVGEVVGLTLASGGEALAGRDAESDVRNERVRDVADLVLSKLPVPGFAGKVAVPLVRLAAGHVVDNAFPDGAEAATRAGTVTALDDAQRRAVVATRTLVSQAHAWRPDQSPDRWAATTPRAVERFWDDAGTPLAEERLTSAQQLSFEDWRRDEALSIYEAAPLVVQDGIDRGARTAVALVGRQGRG